MVWLSELSVCLQTERLLVRFLVRAHPWVEGQVPCWGLSGGNQSMFLSHIDVSLLVCLPPFYFLKKKKEKHLEDALLLGTASLRTL